MQFLLLCGAKVNTRNAEGRTPLHYVQDATAAETLLLAGGDPSIKDAKGVCDATRPGTRKRLCHCKHDLHPNLKNAVIDATAMRSKLTKGTGFKVDHFLPKQMASCSARGKEQMGVKMAELDSGLMAFGKSIQVGETACFYDACHSVQWGDDVYLICQDTPPCIYYLRHQALSVEDVLLAMCPAKTKTVIIDGCRLYPEDLYWRGTKPFPRRPTILGPPAALAMRGLDSAGCTEVEVVAFTCGPREEAEDELDPRSSHGLYTRHLLDRIDTDQDLTDILDTVRNLPYQ